MNGDTEWHRQCNCVVIETIETAQSPSTSTTITAHTKHTKCCLGLDKTTGRVKWCPDCKYVKYLILLPIILLPIIVVLILTMQFNIFAYGNSIKYVNTTEIKIIDRDSNLVEHHRDYRSADNIPNNVNCYAFRHTTSESFDIHEKEIFRDIRTSFIPSRSVVVPINCVRQHLNKTNDLNNSIDGDKKLQTNQLISEHWPTKYSQSVENNNIEMDLLHRRHLNQLYHRKRRQIVQNNTIVNETLKNDNLDDKPHDIPAVLKTFWKGGKTWDQIRHSQVEIMKQYMDETAKPCDDFYQYACGNWQNLNPIPKDKAAYDTFEMLREILDIELNTLLADRSDDHPNCSIYGGTEGSVTESGADKFVIDVGNSIDTMKTLAKSDDEKINQRHSVSDDGINPIKCNLEASKQISAEQKAKFLYDSCMNSEILSNRGIEPLTELLQSLGGWPVIEMTNWNETNFDWLQLAAKLRLFNNDIFLMQWVGPDIKNSDENVIQFDQTSLGLPTREYFLQPTSLIYLNAYREFAEKVMFLCGATEKESIKTSEEIIKFEIELASITATPEERVNVSQIYKRMNVGSLQQQIPDIDWERYLEIVLERPVNRNETVVMFAVNFMYDLVVLLNRTESRTISNYMFWKFVRHRINNVDDRFQEAKQKFYNVLIGREKSPPRWKACVNQVNSNMGMAVGAMFVRKYFDEKSKQDTMAMTHELQDSFRIILNETDWIDEPTKKLAELKVNGMSLKIGYPDYILNIDELDDKYKDLEIHPDQYFENILNVLVHLTRTEQNKLTQVVNRTVWNTAPAVVNAYYSRNKNQIMFPAGILQPPFYHRHLPRSLNFGGIGVVIGHELTHGFDDKGRLFDRDGNLHRWWSEKAIEAFHQRANCLISQYGNYKMSEIGGLAVDGTITQGENIADNGGIKQAFRAYEKWLRNHCHSNECIEQEHMPGLNATNRQLFFINFAQVWCGAMRPEATKNKMKTAVHSPGRFRVIGEILIYVYFIRLFYY